MVQERTLGWRGGMDGSGENTRMERGNGWIRSETALIVNVACM
jgi:hypothetical protein